MKTIREYKRAARASLRGNWAPAVLASLALLFLAVLLSVPTELFLYANLGPALFFGLQAGSLLISTFLVVPLGVGYAVACLMLYETNDDRLSENMFKTAFSRYWHKVGGMFLMSLKVWLWSLLLVIPGIIMAHAYAMTPYILEEHPEIGAWEASRVSQKMMRGHKFRLFRLYLSFIGWALLCVPTLGVGFLWLVPYMQMSQAAFYSDLKAQQGDAAITE
jgi:uncharacterized membrane protein